MIAPIRVRSGRRHRGSECPAPKDLAGSSGPVPSGAGGGRGFEGGRRGRHRRGSRRSRERNPPPVNRFPESCQSRGQGIDPPRRHRGSRGIAGSSVDPGFVDTFRVLPLPAGVRPAADGSIIRPCRGSAQRRRAASLRTPAARPARRACARACEARRRCTSWHRCCSPRTCSDRSPDAAGRPG